MKNTVSLKENHEFRRLYYQGVSSTSRHMILYCRKNRTQQRRLGLTVSVKLGNAVKRNRVKRLLREAYRLHETAFPAGTDIVLVARSQAVGASYHEIEHSLLRVLEKNKLTANQS